MTPTEVKVTIQDGFCEHGVPKPELPVAIENVACGATHTLALSVEDEVWAWGCGEQLGLEDLHHAPVPRRIESLIGRRVLMVASGDSHSMALVQKVERTHRTLPSPSRHKKVSKEAVVTQKYYPSLCSRCNKEIYTYTDTNDTCIIDDVHECQVEDSGISSESCALGADDESCTFGSQMSSEKSVPSSLTTSEDTGRNSQSSEAEPKEARDSEDAGEHQEQLDEGFGDATLVKLQCPAGKELADNNSADLSMLHTKAGSTDDVFEKSSEEGVCQSAQTGIHKNSVAEVFSVTCTESEGEVWKQQSASQERVTQFEEKVTSLDGAGSPPCDIPARSRTPSSGSVVSLSKLKNFIDEQQARQYLSRQLNDEAVSSGENLPTLPVEEDKATLQPQTQETSLSSWKSFLPYSTSMFETVKTITSKALDNIQNTMDSLVGQQNVELNDMSESKQKTSQDIGTAAGADLGAHTSAALMTDSSSSMEFGPEVSYSSHLHDSDRSSISPPTVPATVPAEDFQEGRQSLRTIEMKQQNLQRKTSTPSASKGQ